MRVRVNAWYNSFIATQQTPVMSFWNITDNVHEIWSQVTTSTTAGDMTQQLVGTVVLTSGKFYTIRIGATNYSLKGFGCIIDEILEISSNTFTYSNSGVAPLSVINTGTGNSALGV